MRNKVIILDLDGVVVDSPKQKLPSKELVKATKELIKDYYICAATGRVWTFTKDILQMLDLQDPCIISAGTQIVKPQTGEVVWQKSLKKEMVDRVIKLLREYPDYKLMYNDSDSREYFFGGTHAKDFKAKEPVYVINFIFVPDELAKEIAERLNKIDGVVCIMAVAQKPGMRDLHITNSQATKEQAIKELLQMIKVKKENTIGVGDGHNDINLFKAVGRKIAMGNAVEDLKKTADVVIGSVKDDGLVDYFKTLIK